MPQWVGSDGYPLSWRHYIYGTAYMMRERHRRLLDMASAARVAQAKKEDYRRWRYEVQQATR